MMVLIALTGITLEFDGDQQGIKDVNGVGTGFNTRFPGSLNYENDPNLELNDGVLNFKGQYADWGTPENLDLPAISFSGFPGPTQIVANVEFKSLSLSTLDSVAGLFVGLNSQNILIISADAYYNPDIGGADGSYKIALTSIKNDVWSRIELDQIFPDNLDLNLSLIRNDKNQWIGTVESDGQQYQFPQYSFGGYFPEVFAGIFNFNGDGPSKVLDIEIERFSLNVSEETTPWGWPEPLTHRWKREQELYNSIPSAINVPEPNSIFLLLLGMILFKGINYAKRPGEDYQR